MAEFESGEVHYAREDIDGVYNMPLSKFSREFSITLTLSDNAENQHRISFQHSSHLIELKRDLTAGLTPPQRHFRLQEAFNSLVKDTSPGTVKYLDGQTIYDPTVAEDFQARTLYFIVKGHVELISKAESNLSSKRPTRRFLGEGDCFGFWHFLLGSEHATMNNSFRRGATCKGIPIAIARTTSVEVCCLLLYLIIKALCFILHSHR